MNIRSKQLRLRSKACLLIGSLIFHAGCLNYDLVAKKEKVTEVNNVSGAYLPLDDSLIGKTLEEIIQLYGISLVDVPLVIPYSINGKYHCFIFVPAENDLRLYCIIRGSYSDLVSIPSFSNGKIVFPRSMRNCPMDLLKNELKKLWALPSDARNSGEGERPD